MTKPFKRITIAKVMTLLVYILVFLACAVVTAIDLKSGKAPAGAIAVDFALSGLWLTLSARECRSFIKWRRAANEPGTVRLVTSHMDITVVACPALQSLVETLAYNAQDLSAQKLAMAVQLYDPDKERIEYERHPIEDYLADPAPTVSQDSQN